jgi:hypothetical protein
MVMIVVALAVLVAAIGIVLMRLPPALPPAQNDEEKAGQQHKRKNDEQFHDRNII